MTVKLTEEIQKEAWYPANCARPFTEMEVLIDVLLRGPAILEDDPFQYSIRWMWEYGETRRFIQSCKSHFKSNKFYTEGEAADESKSQRELKAQEVINIFNEVFERTGNRICELTPSRVSMINARIKEGKKMKPPIGPAQFRAVFEFKKKQWIGTDMEKYLRISTLCNSEKFYEYLEAARIDYKKQKEVKKQEEQGVMLQKRLFDEQC